MSEQDEDRIRKNAVRLRFRLGGLTGPEVIEAQNWLQAMAKMFVPPMLARHENGNGVEPIPPERAAELRRRFGIPQAGAQ